MRTRTLLTTLAALLGVALLAPDAQAAKRGHVQKLSVKGAKSICEGHGGFNDGGCSFCHTTNNGHCHVITCDSQKRCYNIVSSSRPPPDSGKSPNVVGNPVTGAKGVGTGSWKGKGPSGTSGFKPTSISGFKPTGTGGFDRRK